MDTLRAVVFTTLFFLALPGASNASEDSEEGHKTHLETSAIWGYSFLFNFLGCLPSAFCVIVCLWAKLRIAEKVVTNLMAFASGVSIDQYYQLQQTNNATTGPHWRNTFPSFEGYCRRFFWRVESRSNEHSPHHNQSYDHDGCLCWIEPQNVQR